MPHIAGGPLPTRNEPKAIPMSHYHQDLVLNPCGLTVFRNPHNSAAFEDYVFGVGAGGRRAITMLPLGGYQTANPLRDRFVVAFPLKPTEDPSIKGGVTALFQNESGIYYVVDDPPLFGAWPLRLVHQEYEGAKSLKPAELTSEQVATRWIVSYLRFVCPAALEAGNGRDPNSDR